MLSVHREQAEQQYYGGATTMKTYEKNVHDRKVLVKRLEDLTGEKGKYSFVPRMAYLFTGCAVEKDGSLTVEEGMDVSVIDILISEGLIKANTLDAVENAEENGPQESQNRPEPRRRGRD
jgi:hypothetical protein